MVKPDDIDTIINLPNLVSNLQFLINIYNTT